MSFFSAKKLGSKQNQYIADWKVFSNHKNYTNSTCGHWLHVLGNSFLSCSPAFGQEIPAKLNWFFSFEHLFIQQIISGDSGCIPKKTNV